MHNLLLNIITLMFLASCCSGLGAQNLIPNPDFEVYDTCPTAITTWGDQQIEHCTGWYAPTLGTSDYFNTCSTGIQVSIPSNMSGYQMTYSGNGYCGIAISNAVTAGGHWFEYIQSKLVEPLKAGYRYEMSFFVSASDNMLDYAIWQLGAHFSKDAISRSNWKPFDDVVPQVMNEAGNFITDTAGWTEISGSFVAQGGEQYVTIGMFADTVTYDTLRMFPWVQPYEYTSYYLIDGLSLTDKEQVVFAPNVFSPNGDGNNDVFYLRGSQFELMRFIIYNRWGEKVFETTDLNTGWDGTHKGEKVNPGVFVWYAEAEWLESGEAFVQKGNITLVR